MRFTKMHGIGNEYVYVDCFDEQVADARAVAVAVSDRHFGIGADGLILIMPSETADVRMRMFNADGSQGRCAATAFAVWRSTPTSTTGRRLTLCAWRPPPA